MPPPHAWEELCLTDDRRVSPRTDRCWGVNQTLAWLTFGEVAPITGRLANQRDRQHARAESWAALCVAAGMPDPTPEDWRRLGADPLPVERVDPEFAYGVWRTLSWLLGVREDWPVYSAWHSAARLPKECPHFYVPKQDRDTPEWRAADQAARERARAEAREHWEHIRGLADATAGGVSRPTTPPPTPS
ncbi:MAG: hypothetical protein JWO67_1322 [Streptosporangiaceae bacterium]|nr:hypothetical protein [Streptosporangiaceae bacterium]